MLIFIFSVPFVIYKKNNNKKMHLLSAVNVIMCLQ